MRSSVERFSFIGKNRVGLTVTLFGKDDDIHLFAVATGGSRAMFFKINTFVEDAFPDKLIEIVSPYQKNNKIEKNPRKAHRAAFRGFLYLFFGMSVS